MSDFCDHFADQGCMWCCQKCNSNSHNCPGCGDDLEHGQEVCRACQIEHGQIEL